MYERSLFLLLTVFASKGLCVTEIWMPDNDVDYIQSDILSVTFSLTKWLWDTLEECHVIVPNGTKYEAYPNNNLPPYMSFLQPVQPFADCSVIMKGVGPEMSGPYVLLSLVRHSNDNSQTLTRQKNNLSVRQADPGK